MTDHEPRPERRLAAIMALDAVGYSSLMRSNEAAALTAITAIRRATQDQVKQHGGRIANTGGDSVLAEFGSTFAAVSCAMALQEELSNLGQACALQVRIGLHIGDVVDNDGEMHGTPVNIAARLEGTAPPGGIVVSAAVRDDVVGKLFTFADLGPKILKNIEEPFRAYLLTRRTGSLSPRTPRNTGEALPLPTKPSIAVLPFDDLSDKRDQEYFADGMVEEIITALSRMRWLFVIARNSSFAYKGRDIDVRQIGCELGVHYVLEGSVRRAGNKVRINGQLIDTTKGVCMWADHFEGSLDNIFELQDQVTSSVVGAISPRLEQAEIERTKRKPTENLDAYDYFLRGIAGLHLWTKESNKEALSYFYRAIELDPSFASAYGMAARCFSRSTISGWVTDREQEVAEAIRLARRAVELGKDDAVPLCFGGWALAFVAGDLDTGDGLIERALVLNPNLASGWLCSGWVRVCLGEPELAIDRVTRAMRLSPSDPLFNHMQGAIATAHFFANRYDQASSLAEEALREEPDYPSGLRVAAASNALAGRVDAAQKAMAALRQYDPALRISNLADRLPLRRPDDSARWSKGMRLAGLPE